MRPTSARVAVSVVVALAWVVSVVEAGKKKKQAEETELYPEIEHLQDHVSNFLSQASVYTALIGCFSVLVLFPKYTNEFMKEFFGMIIMVFCTFAPGPFFGKYKGYEEWLMHMVGVVVADYTCGGPQVNPAVTTAMLVWQKLSVAQWISYIAAQVAGGIVAFPMMQTCADIYKVTIGGPGIQPGVTLNEAIQSEGLATFALVMGIFVFCTTAIGKVYHVKQPIVAMLIRACIFNFGKTGPAINPALGTTWAFFAAGSVWPTDVSHYLVYWVAPMVAATAASLFWSCLNSNGPFEPPRGADEYAPANLEEAWAHHMDAFAKQDANEIMKSYEPTAVLLKKNSEVMDKTDKIKGVKSIREELEKLFHALHDLTGMNAKVEVDDATKTVYLVWSCESSKVSQAVSSFVFSDDYKIKMQHLTMTTSKKEPTVVNPTVVKKAAGAAVTAVEGAKAPNGKR